MLLNPLTLRVPLESIVCYVHTFANNSETKKNSKIFLGELFDIWLTFLLQIFSKKMLLFEKYLKLSSLFWPLRVNGLRKSVPKCLFYALVQHLWSINIWKAYKKEQNPYWEVVILKHIGTRSLYYCDLKKHTLSYPLVTWFITFHVIVRD